MASPLSNVEKAKLLDLLESRWWQASDRAADEWNKVSGEEKGPWAKMSVLHKQRLWVAAGNIHSKWQVLVVSS